MHNSKMSIKREHYAKHHFIFAKQLSEQQIQQFSVQTDAKLLKQAAYLGYNLAFLKQI
ncbi:phosphoserine phosphatase [Actinobacillus equuli]|nr:phosphoserine phosphatase [Actinobacillus equuli]